MVNIAMMASNFIVSKKTSAYSGKTTFIVRAIGKFENTPQPAPKDLNGLPMGKKTFIFDVDKVKEIIIKVHIL